MENEKHHITPYNVYVKILILLLFLTAITILVTYVELGPLSVTVALGIASLKVFIVLAYFMHLKFDDKMFRIMVAGIFLLLFLIIVVTFIDYTFR